MTRSVIRATHPGRGGQEPNEILRSRVLFARIISAGPLLDRGTLIATFFFEDLRQSYQGEPPMLPPFIIEQIRKREQEEQRYEQPQLDLPVPQPRPKKDVPEEESNRGVIILDL
jgi:hypothetical protein